MTEETPRAQAPNIVEELARQVGGTITEVGGPLSDRSGFAIMSIPLKPTHWIYKQEGDGFNVPPMPFRMGVKDEALFAVKRAGAPMPDILTREQLAELFRQVGRYAVKCATMNGTEMDFGPDALVQNLVVGALGYWTEDGFSS